LEEFLGGFPRESYRVQYRMHFLQLPRVEKGGVNPEGDSFCL
jgi:hypothetical protein